MIVCFSPPSRRTKRPRVRGAFYFASFYCDFDYNPGGVSTPSVFIMTFKIDITETIMKSPITPHIMCCLPVSLSAGVSAPFMNSNTPHIKYRIAKANINATNGSIIALSIFVSSCFTESIYQFLETVNCWYYSQHLVLSCLDCLEQSYFVTQMCLIGCLQVPILRS